MSFRDEILRAARQKVLFTLHALNQMNKPDRMISEDEVKGVVLEGEVIAEDSKDPRGASCLILGWPEKQRPIHVVCAPKSDYLAVITAYVPSPEEWEADFKTRRNQ